MRQYLVIEEIKPAIIEVGKGSIKVVEIGVDLRQCNEQKFDSYLSCEG